MRYSEESHRVVLTMILICVLLAGFTALSQHVWAPFEGRRSEQLTVDGNFLNATINAHVLRRYPARFRERIVHLDSGQWFGLRDHESLTAQTGQFVLPKRFELPDNYAAGRYCHITESWIRYNVINEQFKVYPPACVDVIDEWVDQSMPASYVFGWNQGETGTIETTTVDVDTIGATSGNLLIAFLATRGSNAITSMTESNWTAIISAPGNSAESNGYMFYREADGTTSDNFVPSWSGAVRTQAIVQEFTGVDVASGPEDSDEDETNVATLVISQDVGSITPTSADGIAIACLSAYTESGWADESTTIDSSFANMLAVANFGAQPVAGMASLVYSSTAALSPTWDTDSGESGAGAYGCIACFAATGGGGGSTLVAGSLSMMGTGI